ncbi:hypothetical protein [Mycolicibacterium fallax]|uniref:Uncharacterized protein n=1 Tax=Mycolicibacterium fallax TaxID=1793 RepID=A0A1X1R7Z7_MYCFA|nr:hypothetical protein [Mycolicibacterium fallax]ORV00979.1 hypothetical protein AWC04_15005 [Mycolicibacterium fallax]BBZ00534.1 hypothetical protein MFAL_40000 [Mycolicibacterium fallax]
MSNLKTPAAPLVVAVDVTTRGVSIARITAPLLEAADKPLSAFVPQPADEGLAHTAYSTWHRATDLVKRSYAKITLNDERPTLVLFAKPIWGDLKTDPSAFRRHQIVALLQDRLHKDRVPVGEFPLPTLLKWMTGSGVAGKGRGVMAALNKAVVDQWGTPSASHSATAEGTPYNTQFRQSTVALAAAAAMAVGLETQIPVVQSRLNYLSGYETESAITRANKSVMFPTRRKPPRTVEAWRELNAHPETLLRVVDKDNAEEDAA